MVCPDELPVVYERFVPDSQVTFPEESFLMYLYSNHVFTGTLNAPDRIGLPVDKSLTPFDVSQRPGAAIEPTTWTSWPEVAQAYALKCRHATARDTGAVEEGTPRSALKVLAIGFKPLAVKLSLAIRSRRGRTQEP